MKLRVLTQPPNYGKTTVSKTANPLGRLVGGEPVDRRGTRGNAVKVRRGGR